VVEPEVVDQVDEDLTVAGVVTASGDAERAPLVAKRSNFISHELRRQGVVFIRPRTTALQDEIRNHPMEGEPVVAPFLREGGEGGDAGRSLFGKQLEGEGADVLHRDDRRGAFERTKRRFGGEGFRDVARGARFCLFAGSVGQHSGRRGCDRGIPIGKQRPKLLDDGQIAGDSQQFNQPNPGVASCGATRPRESQDCFQNPWSKGPQLGSPLQHGGSVQQQARVIARKCSGRLGHRGHGGAGHVRVHIAGETSERRFIVHQPGRPSRVDTRLPDGVGGKHRETPTSGFRRHLRERQEGAGANPPVLPPVGQRFEGRTLTLERAQGIDCGEHDMAVQILNRGQRSGAVRGEADGLETDHGRRIVQPLL